MGREHRPGQQPSRCMFGSPSCSRQPRESLNNSQCEHVGPCGLSRPALPRMGTCGDVSTIWHYFRRDQQFQRHIRGPVLRTNDCYWGYILFAFTMWSWTIALYPLHKLQELTNIAGSAVTWLGFREMHWSPFFFSPVDVYFSVFVLPCFPSSPIDVYFSLPQLRQQVLLCLKHNNR